MGSGRLSKASVFERRNASEGGAWTCQVQILLPLFHRRMMASDRGGKDHWQPFLPWPLKIASLLYSQLPSGGTTPHVVAQALDRGCHVPRRFSISGLPSARCL